MVSYKALINFLWKFICRQKWTFLGIFLLDSLAWPLHVLLWPYILSLVINVFTHFEGNRLAAWQALQGLIIGGICLALFSEVASRTMGFLIAKATPQLQADIRMEMFDHIQHHSPRYFNERFAGSLANKITDMTIQAELIIQQLFWPILPALIACIAGTVVLGFINPNFGLILGLWILIHLGTILKFTRPIDAYEHRHGEARSALLGKIVDSFTNNFAVNLFYRFKYERNALCSDQKIEEKTNVQVKQYTEKMNYIFFLFCWEFSLLEWGSDLFVASQPDKHSSSNPGIYYGMVYRRNHVANWSSLTSCLPVFWQCKAGLFSDPRSSRYGGQAWCKGIENSNW